MPRTARIILPNYPHHIIQRGHNRQAVFAGEDDYRYYLENLAEWNKEKGDRFIFEMREIRTGRWRLVDFRPFASFFHLHNLSSFPSWLGAPLPLSETHDRNRHFLLTLHHSERK